MGEGLLFFAFRFLWFDLAFGAHVYQLCILVHNFFL